MRLTEKPTQLREFHTWYKVCNLNNPEYAFCSCHSHEETHNMKFMCNICGHQTNRQAYLQQHVQLVHQKKSYDVKCTECDLIFVDHSRMLKHRNLGGIQDGL